MTRAKICFLYICSFILSILPVGVYFIANADRYLVTLQDRVKISVGLVLLSVIVFLKVTGKLKMPSRVTLFGIVFLMSYLLGSILADIMIFSLLALMGEIMDSICQIFIKRAKREAQAQRVAQITANEMERILNGRV